MILLPSTYLLCQSLSILSLLPLLYIYACDTYILLVLYSLSMRF